MDLQLENRVAVVSAASQGLGYATALQLSREGALVTICSRNEAHLQAVADAMRAETGKAVLAVAADVTKSDEVQTIYERVIDEFGGVDILVTNCGGPPSTAFEDTTDDMWRAAFDQLLMSTIFLIRGALPHLRQSTVPAVLAITGLAVKAPIPNLILSNSVRMSVIGLIKSLALELGVERIRFNSILPGRVATERGQELLAARAARTGRTPEDELAALNETLTFKRMATPQEFANVAAFLCSPAASYVSGAMINIDGASYPGVY